MVASMRGPVRVAILLGGELPDRQTYGEVVSIKEPPLPRLHRPDRHLS